MLRRNREEVHDPVHALRGVERVEGRKDEVSGLCRRQRRAHRLLVAHLADQDHVRILPQHAAQGAGERGGVTSHLALVDHGATVAVDELDRVLDRDDVPGALGVDLVDHRGERGGLAGARGSRDEHDAALLTRKLRDHWRKRQFLNRIYKSLPAAIHWPGYLIGR